MKSVRTALLLACLSAVLFSCQKEMVAPTVKIDAISNPAKNIASPISTPDPVIGNVNVAITLTGNWTLVNDSTFSTGIGATTQGTGTNYAGQPGDHFNFTAEGKVYIQEGKNIDTANYTITADRKIIVNYLYFQGLPVTNYGSVIDSFNQLDLKAGTVTLSSAIITPGSSFTRIINLKR